MKSTLGFPFVQDPEQQRNNLDLLTGINAVAQFVFAGVGAPTSTPDGPALYFRQDPAAGAAIYGFDGTNWKVII